MKAKTETHELKPRETEVLKCLYCGQRHTVSKVAKRGSLYRVICDCGAKLS